MNEVLIIIAMVIFILGLKYAGSRINHPMVFIIQLVVSAGVLVLLWFNPDEGKLFYSIILTALIFLNIRNGFVAMRKGRR